MVTLADLLTPNEIRALAEITLDGESSNTANASKHLNPVCEYCGNVFDGNKKRCESCGAPRAYTVTVEQFRAMSYEERLALKQKNEKLCRHLVRKEVIPHG